MKKIGLALSGGGFRATLYHLGLARFLHDAGILPSVTHITSVSGGSIFAAHLAMNWHRYNGSDSDFDAAAAELLAFVRMDVRNRIIRRFPLSFLVPWPAWLRRRLSRTGLLVSHYEKYLVGDTSLFQLPASPQLHILATNLSEGCLCSFNREGLIMVRRQEGHAPQIDRVHIGLATLAMAVTASSAFPGFFPPLVLTGAEVGASGEFDRQAYTDGGVFDNLGVRMFRCLEQESGAGNRPWDAVLVSDVGKSIEVQSGQRAGGMISTAMRASDILMDRVWQLENDTFADTPGFVFARITDIVERHEDPTALHPEIQHRTAGIRTDLDAFSPLEISSLIRHGYCVGRKVGRANPDLFGADLPAHGPWDPISAEGSKPAAAPPPAVPAPPPQETGVELSAAIREPSEVSLAAAGKLQAPALTREPIEVTRQARELQASASRRIWGRLLNYRDWVSYVYVPILVPIITLLPWMIARYYRHTHNNTRLIESISQGTPDFEIMSRLMDGPIGQFPGEVPEQVSKFEPLSFKGFEVLQDSNIFDLRPWNPDVARMRESMLYGYRRLRILKTEANVGNDTFRIDMLATSLKAQIRFPEQQLRPRLHIMRTDNSAAGEELCRYEMSVDFQKVPHGDIVDVIYEYYTPGMYLQRGEKSSTLGFPTEANTAEVTRWFLMPHGHEYKNFRILRHETGKPGSIETVRGYTEYLADDSTILAYKMSSVKAGYTYETTWFYK
jgi:predicted acylesterase/phospholipase RssA